ncbi:MAG: hypothetical protein FJ298_05160, partial [Planctomycetes bacterium]|nr:hypothetical protein [Planctomycetota bacterium]
MNQRKLLLGSIPLLLVAALALLWLRPENAPPTDAVAEFADAAPELEVAAPSELAAAADDARASEHRSDVAATDTQAEREAKLREDSIAVPVHTRLPAGVPADEFVELIATSFPLSAYGDGNSARRAASRWDSSGVDMGRLFRNFSGEGSETPKDARALSLACEPDGRGGYLARFAKDSPVGVIELRARYCYIKQPIEVKLPGTGAAVTLEPKLGGWLTGHVVLPARVPAGFDAAALAEVDAVLVGWSMGGDNHSLSARLAPDLSFSAGGLRAGLNYFLTIDPRVMVPVIDAELTAREGEHVHKTYTLAAGA